MKNFGATLTGLLGLATSGVGALSIGTDSVNKIVTGVLATISGILVIVLQFKINEDALFRPKLTTYKLYDKMTGATLPDIPQHIVSPWERSNTILREFQDSARIVKYISDCICLIRVWMIVGEDFTEPKSSAILIDLIPKLVELSNRINVFGVTHDDAKEDIRKYHSLLYALREPEVTRRLFTRCFSRVDSELQLLTWCDEFDTVQYRRV